MKRYACVIVAAVLAVCSCEKTVKIMDVISDDAISALRTTDVEVVGDEIVMISTGIWRVPHTDKLIIDVLTVKVCRNRHLEGACLASTQTIHVEQSSLHGSPCMARSRLLHKRHGKII